MKMKSPRPEKHRPWLPALAPDPSRLFDLSFGVNPCACLIRTCARRWRWIGPRGRFRLSRACAHRAKSRRVKRQLYATCFAACFAPLQLRWRFTGKQIESRMRTRPAERGHPLPGGEGPGLGVLEAVEPRTLVSRHKVILGNGSVRRQLRTRNSKAPAALP